MKERLKALKLQQAGKPEGKRDGERKSKRERFRDRADVELRGVTFEATGDWSACGPCARALVEWHGHRRIAPRPSTHHGLPLAATSDSR